MKPRQLIIHFENCDDPQMALLRVYKALSIYYEHKRQEDKRLTVRFDKQGAMIIYHDKGDVVIFGQEK